MLQNDLSSSVSVFRALVFVAAAGAAFGVTLQFEPRISLVQERIDEDARSLLNDEVSFNSLTRLRSERDSLRGRFASFYKVSLEVTFVHELSTIARRNALRVVSITFERAQLPPAPRRSFSPSKRFRELHITLTLAGSYRDLLQSIAELSRGNELIFVNRPSLRHDGNSIVASVPVTIFEPEFAEQQ